MVHNILDTRKERSGSIAQMHGTESDARKRIGAALAAARQAAGLTQTDVANDFDTRQGTVSSWETGATTPKADELARMVQLYRMRCVDLVAMLGGTAADDMHAAELRGKWLLDVGLSEEVRRTTDPQAMRDLVARQDMMLARAVYPVPDRVRVVDVDTALRESHELAKIATLVASGRAGKRKDTRGNHDRTHHP